MTVCSCVKLSPAVNLCTASRRHARLGPATASKLGTETRRTGAKFASLRLTAPCPQLKLAAYENTEAPTMNADGRISNSEALDTRFRSALARMARDGRVLTRQGTSDPHLEIASIMKAMDGDKALFFPRSPDTPRPWSATSFAAGRIASRRSAWIFVRSAISWTAPWANRSLLASSRRLRSRTWS